jgi:hypothetical protein
MRNYSRHPNFRRYECDGKQMRDIDKAKGSRQRKNYLVNSLLWIAVNNRYFKLLSPVPSVAKV